MSKNRRGEKLKMRFRSDRMFFADNKWYFSTREGEERGPFDSKEEAEVELVRYLYSIGGLSGASNGKQSA